MINLLPSLRVLTRGETVGHADRTRRTYSPEGALLCIGLGRSHRKRGTAAPFGYFRELNSSRNPNLVFESAREISQGLICCGRSFITVPMNNSKQNPPGFAAPLIVLVILLLHIVIQLQGPTKKKGKTNPEEAQLMQEIKCLLKEANSLSSPSTFAKSAMLRRTAAAKEKELAQIRQKLAKEKSWASQPQLTMLQILKACIYLGFGWWFWGIPIAAVSSQLLQPFGNALSWRVGSSEEGFVLVGIIPWLLLTTRVSAFISDKLVSRQRDAILKKDAVPQRMSSDT